MNNEEVSTGSSSSAGDTPATTSLPPFVVLGLDEFEGDLLTLDTQVEETDPAEFSFDRGELIKEVFDSVADERLAEQEVALSAEGIMDRMPHELDLAMSHYIRCFYALAEAMQTLLRLHRLYRCGRVPYVVWDVKPGCVVLIHVRALKRMVDSEAQPSR